MSTPNSILTSPLFELIMDDDIETMFLRLLELDALDEESSSQKNSELDAVDEESSSRKNSKRKYIERGREDGDNRLWNDFFASEPMYPESFFRQRFGMNIPLFNRIVDVVSRHCHWFLQRFDTTGRKSLSPRQKCICAIRQLACGTSSDQCDEYIRIGETAAILCLQKFCRSIIEVFSEEYLRRPNEIDIQRLQDEHSSVYGFPGMLGSIDCIHWPWKNCQVSWEGMHTRGDNGQPTLMLEAVASHDLWIWHAYFGVVGSNDDINVINQSPPFNEVLEGNPPQCNFSVNGTQYTQGYYLADEIYPEWSTLVKSSSYPPTDKLRLFRERQESARKDVKRAFGVLQDRWGIIRGPTKSWSLDIISDIMYTCIILHNMIVEDEGHDVSDWSRDEDEDELPSYEHGAVPAFQTHLNMVKNSHSEEAHQALQNDLVEHIWTNKE